MAYSEDGKSFAAYIGQITKGALVAHGIGIGANLKIFDVIASLGKPATSPEIANAGGFKERYDFL